jgi:hypothetical protein
VTDIVAEIDTRIATIINIAIAIPIHFRQRRTYAWRRMTIHIERVDVPGGIAK